MDDNGIVELFFARSERAVEATAEKYGAYCLAVAENILPVREDAEECVNDTWLRAWDSIPPARPERLKLFLARITRNLALDRYRRETCEKRGGQRCGPALDELGEICADIGGVDDGIAVRELSDAVNAYLHTVPTRERSIFIRRYFYFNTTANIAASFCMKEGTVNRSLSRTRAKLTDHLKKKGFLT